MEVVGVDAVVVTGHLVAGLVPWVVLVEVVAAVGRGAQVLTSVVAEVLEVEAQAIRGKVNQQ